MDHTKGEWREAQSGQIEGGDGLLVALICGKGHRVRKPSEHNANADLIVMAPTAPHECDPDCPGEQNRRKLEMFEEMLAITKSSLAFFQEFGFGARAIGCEAVVKKAESVEAAGWTNDSLKQAGAET